MPHIPAYVVHLARDHAKDVPAILTSQLDDVICKVFPGEVFPGQVFLIGPTV